MFMPLAPARIVFERENMLDCFGAARPGLQECLDCLPQLAQPKVGLLAAAVRRPVDPIENRGDLQDLVPRFQEVMTENLDRVS